VEQLARHHLGRHEDAAGLPPPHLQHAGLDERLDGLPKRGTADPHLRGELTLGWEAIADVEIARLHLLGDLLNGLLERPAGRDGLE
jgi:hypothetical protein